ncbi:cytochrome c biogenesis CcdA family protein [Pseudoalteromonas phenolica]|uniref:cytochrome c biogenesis CcdA family protein n=1 Tax=Pseudoalteromonas phenolica TaxID=161398 RepID=UPI00110B1CFA|nr:cytochrome c biogenesis protein CcdA [Pseudoalteromonas phenolica]TMO57162.1 cytochrome C biogenesis protein [Pseudoalteromonas phenolica]
MGIEFVSLPLALMAGVLSILSPCVWPLVPIVMASSSNNGKKGQFALALGLSVAFALAGGVLTFILFSLGLSPEVLRWFGAAMLVLMGVSLLIPKVANWLSLVLTKLTPEQQTHQSEQDGVFSQFMIGMMLGLVWLPCVGPTLGTAIALASLGQDILMASSVLFLFGLGTASALIITSIISSSVLQKLRPNVFSNVEKLKKLLGLLLLILALMVITGFDKTLETIALNYLPSWVTGV